MARLHLVRHGRAAAAWADHTDPGLDPVGVAEADATAADLAGRLAPTPIRSSPLLRTQLTARPLAERWGATVVLDPAFGEVPSPSDDPAERSAWLSSALVLRWTDLGATVEAWHDRLLRAARDLDEDTVVFTHFVAINALVGAADARPETVVFAPANGSVTELDVDPATGTITVIRLGPDAASTAVG